MMTAATLKLHAGSRQQCIQQNVITGTSGKSGTPLASKLHDFNQHALIMGSISNAPLYTSNGYLQVYLVILHRPPTTTPTIYSHNSSSTTKIHSDNQLPSKQVNLVETGFPAAYEISHHKQSLVKSGFLAAYETSHKCPTDKQVDFEEPTPSASLHSTPRSDQHIISPIVANVDPYLSANGPTSQRRKAKGTRLLARLSQYKNHNGNITTTSVNSTTTTVTTSPINRALPMQRRQYVQTNGNENKVSYETEVKRISSYSPIPTHPALLREQALRYHREMTAPSSAQATGSATAFQRNSCERSHIHSTTAANTPPH
uniref:Uncharacterized protein n=1 Tax=Glossina austeni TaxID=7395 RepID=A0A1A9UZY2_GLOAU